MLGRRSRASSCAKSNAIDPNLKDPKNDEIMFAFQRELMNNVSFNVDWIQRWFNDYTIDQNCYGLPCNTTATTAYVQNKLVTDFGPDNLTRHRRRRALTFYARRAGVPRQGHVLPHQLRQQRVGQLHAALQGARDVAQQAHVEPLADAGLVRVVAGSTATWCSTTRTRTTLLPFVGQGRGTADQPHAFKLLGSYQAPYGITSARTSRR